MQAYRDYALSWDARGRLEEAHRVEDGTRIRYHYDFTGERLLKLVSRPGEPEQVYRYIFDGYQERAHERAWIVKAGNAKVAEIIETPGYVPDLLMLDELAGYLVDPVSQPRPLARELLDFDGDGDSTFDEQDLEAATRLYYGEESALPVVRVVRYYHLDHLGSPTHATDSTGELVSGGQPIYGFTGTEIDRETDLGLIRMGARWYAPRLGRWLSPDPLFLEQPDKCLESPGECNLYSYAANNPVAFVDPLGLDSYLVAGGVSVRDPGGHDRFSWNFLNAAALRAKDLKNRGVAKPIHVVMYTPSYERRAQAEGKSKEHYVGIMQSSAKKHGYELHLVRSGDELTSFLSKTKPGQIERLEYFGHSNNARMFLEYSSIQSGVSTDSWGIDEAKKIAASRFASGAEFFSGGCHQGMPGGLAQQMSQRFKFEATGSTTKTDYAPIGQGNWRPSGTYQTYEDGLPK
jgi:RHS repeat-associated protein